MVVTLGTSQGLGQKGFTHVVYNVVEELLANQRCHRHIGLFPMDPCEEIQLQLLL